MGRGGKGLLKQMELSEELAEFMGKDTASRAEVTKELWVYIKKNKCQDEDDKRTIIPDDTLEPILGSKPLSMFKMGSKLSDHLFDE